VDFHSPSLGGIGTPVTRELPCHSIYPKHVLISLDTQLHSAGALRPHNGKRDYVLPAVSPAVVPRAGTWSYVGCYTYVFPGSMSQRSDEVAMCI
jgi:hypothetical protein